MSLKITDEIVKVIPKTQYLSPTDLTQLRNVEVPTASIGLKRTQPQNTEEERIELECLYDQLQRQLCKPRIERLAGRALGAWDPNANAVHVIRKDGKFSTFGYTVNGELYLEYYEAMFLLEVNRLQLEYNSRILSIEQSYLLLMGEEKSNKFNEYLVYSHFTRVGYILVKHQNINFPKYEVQSPEDCVWAILEAELQNDTVPDYVKKTAYYAKTKQQFDQIRNNIKQQRSKQSQNEDDNMEDVKMDFSGKKTVNLKRKAEEDKKEYYDNWNKAKRRRYCSTKIFKTSLVDFLKEEDEYKRFKDQFEKLDIVPLKAYDEDEENPEDMDNALHINFDIYLHNEGFRKSSPHLPSFRVIILEPHQRFPSHKEIFFTHRKQLNAVPLLLVTVNESKQIQAFLYYFS
ncbi:tRNA splicing endonuclease subunit 54 [Haematobia irritans]|uniref:tRNA splicing endonuclease subunit 54 n=1 Tax=Haematobia irritans TaxID=7368 RepID=UPI003F4FD361